MYDRIQKLIDLADTMDNVYMVNELKILKLEIESALIEEEIKGMDKYLKYKYDLK